MNRFPGLRRLMRLDRGGASIEHAVDDELQFHFEMTMRDLMASGMNEHDARRETERRFGDLQRTRERLTIIDRSRVGRERRAEWWSAFAQDLRYAARGLRLSPGFAVAVIVTLGLGIGANATMFGIVDRLLFRPPQFLVAPNRDARLYFASRYRGTENVGSYTGYQPYLDLRTNTRSFEAMTPFYVPRLAIGTGDVTREMKVGVGDADLWRMFDVRPVIGRFFTAQECAPPDGANVAVLSYAFWQTQFGGRKDAIGARLDIGAAKYTVIGVAPQGFNAFSNDPVVAFIPVAAHATAEGYGGPKMPWYSTYNMTWLEVFARRRPGVTAAQASADLTRAYQLSYKRSFELKSRDTPIDLARPRAFVGPVLHDRGPNEGDDAKVATWLVGVAAIVLLIACANVANLLLARALRRRREIAVRIALGVSRGRLLMQLITESLLLAAAGGLVGVAIAQWGGTLVRRLLIGEASADAGAFNDPRLLGFAALLAVAAGLLTGLAPLFQAGREDVASALKTGAREGQVHRSRLRTSLLIGQAALSVVLLVGAGLFVRSLANVQNIRMGYDADRLLWVTPELRGMKLDSVPRKQLLDALLDHAQTVPGVEHAARALTVPFYMTWDLSLFVEGIDSVSKLGEFTLQAGTPDYFATTGTRILRGRGITNADGEHAPKVMVVSQAMARKIWPSADPIGKCVRMDADTMPCFTVVGIAEDTRAGKLSEPELHYYLSTAQFHPTQGGVFVRTSGPAAEQAEAVRHTLQRVMPGVSYVTVTPMSTILAPVVRSWKVGAVMFAVFGLLALVLAAIGLYSVIAYNVTQRTHEMGVRVALGAQARDVIALVLREGMLIVLPGVALGALIALVTGRWVAPLLFDVSPKDPPVLATVVATLIGVAVIASWLPATRAARVDPNEALRAD
jgi:putative ABC transport system permease protein